MLLQQELYLLGHIPVPCVSSSHYVWARISCQSPNACVCARVCFVVTVPTGLSCPGKDSACKCFQHQEGLAPTVDISSPKGPLPSGIPLVIPHWVHPNSNAVSQVRCPVECSNTCKQPPYPTGSLKDSMNMVTPAKACVHERKSCPALALRTREVS